MNMEMRVSVLKKMSMKYSPGNNYKSRAVIFQFYVLGQSNWQMHRETSKFHITWVTTEGSQEKCAVLALST